MRKEKREGGSLKGSSLSPTFVRFSRRATFHAGRNRRWRGASAAGGKPFRCSERLVCPSVRSVDQTTRGQDLAGLRVSAVEFLLSVAETRTLCWLRKLSRKLVEVLRYFEWWISGGSSVWYRWIYTASIRVGIIDGEHGIFNWTNRAKLLHSKRRFRAVNLTRRSYCEEELSLFYWRFCEERYSYRNLFPWHGFE